MSQILSLGSKKSYRIFSDVQERTLLSLVVFSFVCICLLEIKLPLPLWFDQTALGDFLGADATSKVTLGLLYGIVSAYIFYIFIDFLPRIKRESKTIEVLNLLVASILDAYNRSRIYGHETAINFVHTNVLNKEWIKENIGYLQSVLDRAEKERIQNIRVVDPSVTYIKLKLAMAAAHARVDDFRHSLSLVVSLSPEHAMQWLVVIDKIRLLADLYKDHPQISSEKIHLVDLNIDDNPIRDYRLSLVLRVLEVLEQSLVWLDLPFEG